MILLSGDYSSRSLPPPRDSDIEFIGFLMQRIVESRALWLPSKIDYWIIWLGDWPEPSRDLESGRGVLGGRRRQKEVKCGAGRSVDGVPPRCQHVPRLRASLYPSSSISFHNRLLIKWTVLSSPTIRILTRCSNRPEPYHQPRRLLLLLLLLLLLRRNCR